MSRFLRFCLDQKLVVLLLLGVFTAWGIGVAPFEWEIEGIPRSPVPVDAIPDIGENQQLVFTEWPGRSPQDVEDQVTYPLTVSLLGTPGVRTVRGLSMFGLSIIYVIFQDEVEFYWSRSRILEKLASLPSSTLPEGLRPALGPDATPLGQIFWYTIEGRDPSGRPAGGWDLHEIRSVQDWTVRYALQGVEGVSEVASVGGFVREYQIDVDPGAMRAHDVSLADVFRAVQRSNADVGARTIEVNRVEYVIRGVGFIESLDDIEETVVVVRENVPIRVRDVAHVGLGPALRRGALDKGGSEAVGGIIVARYGANPLEVIRGVKERIAEIAPSLPERIREDGTVSKLTIVPFYDRTGLIEETLGTLEEALRLEVLITILVVLVMVRHLRSSALIAGVLPFGILFAFVGMKQFGVDANIVALSGIAIAIGTMVDMGVIVTENILRRLREAPEGETRRESIHRATHEVAGAVLTAVGTTIVSFLPVFTLQQAEGKLFRPLAYTKTFALIGAVILALAIIPPLADLLFRRLPGTERIRAWTGSLAARMRLPRSFRETPATLATTLAVVGLALLLVQQWSPLGRDAGFIRNGLFLLLVVGGFLYGFVLLQSLYPRFLAACLRRRKAFLGVPAGIVLLGGTVFSGMGHEFMPSLDEGSFLYMPTTMPHASIGEALDVLAKIDRAIETIPEVQLVVGKLGRADSALDPAPISMIETIVHYKPEYGRTPDGQVVRNWRPEIRSPDDIWKEIVRVARVPGTTSAPKLQPIETRLIMLQSGMRAAIGVKIRGPSLEVLEQVGIDFERVLKRVPSIREASVTADRVIGKPYLEIRIDRPAIARYGLHVRDVQDVIEIAIGGRPLTTTVEGRERYPVRVRYATELRDSIETIGEILVPTRTGAQVPLLDLATIEYVRGPQAIRSEDTFLVSYVLFDKVEGPSEVEVVEDARDALRVAIESGDLALPVGVSYSFAGTYENQLRSAARLRVVLPLSLLIIFLLLYFQFRSAATSAIVFAGIFVAWAGGFILIWLYGQPWFLNFDIFGANLRDVFQIHPIHLSVAVWVGFIALFGIASDSGVVMATYLEQIFRERAPKTPEEMREAALIAARRRIRPVLMTTGTTVLALLPVLSSTGRGSDIMVPMAIPSFGGMLFSLVSLSVVPVLYCALYERRMRTRG
jgi:Cu(I)/Ag(I) efflux system membrane protein CusA/SilA